MKTTEQTLQARIDEALKDIHRSMSCDAGMHRYCRGLERFCNFHDNCGLRCECDCHPAPVTGRDMERRFGRGDGR